MARQGDETEFTGNFSHLAEFDAALATLGGFAERYFVEDANTALIKVRQFAERMALLIAEYSGLEPRERADFTEILRMLQSDGAAPRDILNVFHHLRRVGNSAVHGLDAERREAFDAIRLCHRLGVWFRATRARRPNLTIAFVPPRARPDETEELKARIREYEERLSQAVTASERLEREFREADEARLSAEDRAALAEEERRLIEELALEAEARAVAAGAVPEPRADFVAAAHASGQTLDLDERDTRLIVDDNLRLAGWEANSEALSYAKGGRPEKNRNRAIAEWPTASGPCDYALFIGTKLVGVVEAKRKRTNVLGALDNQAVRYSEGVAPDASFDFAGGPWGEHRVPFLFATNGREFYPQYGTQSGIWFRDVRRPTNAARALEGWPTPEGLSERLEVDQDRAEEALKGRGFFFGFELRPYQKEAIEPSRAGWPRINARCLSRWRPAPARPSSRSR